MKTSVNEMLSLVWNTVDYFQKHPDLAQGTPDMHELLSEPNPVTGAEIHVKRFPYRFIEDLSYFVRMKKNWDSEGITKAGRAYLMKLTGKIEGSVYGNFPLRFEANEAPVIIDMRTLP